MLRKHLPIVLFIGFLTVAAMSSPHADALGQQGQQIMDIVISVLRQLMVVVVDFIRLVLAEIVNAIKSFF